MEDEETGFTFVDKRRTQEDAIAEETQPMGESSAEPPAQPLTDESVAAADEASQAEGAPDVYGILGYCVSLLSAQAWQLMGLIADPQSGEARPDLVQAKIAIDAAADLAKYLESAPAEIVPDSLRRDLRTLLNDLRLNFVSQRGG